MNRRDFLLFRTESRRRIAELSCERLYMRLLDSRLRGGDASDTALEGESERAPVFSAGSARQLFDGLRQDLQNVDVLRILDRSWLAREDFRAELEPVLATFRARGGVLECTLETANDAEADCPLSTAWRRDHL
jgi:hypothetical protein